MNRLLELWSEFSPKFCVIYQTYLDNLWTKVVLGSFVLLLVILDLIPQWLQALILLISLVMVWSFLTGKKTCEPSKRQFSVTTTNVGGTASGNSRSDSGDWLSPVSGRNSRGQHLAGGRGHASNRREDLDLDDSSSTSLSERQHHGSTRKEPLDAISWSAVTSPGFASRVVQKKGGNPLREFNGSNTSFSPIASSSPKSPSISNGIISPYKPAVKFQPPQFNSPVNLGRYSVTRRKKQVPFGTTFVHVAPVDVINQSLSSAKINNGPGSPSKDRGGIMYGLGGFSTSPPPSLNTRMQKLWSPPIMDAPIPFDSRSNVVPHGAHAIPPNSLVDPSLNRKRNRLADPMLDKKASPIRAGPQGYIQSSKRTKYIQSTNDIGVSAAGRNLPYVTLTHPGSDEAMTSKSILEQMNQTEKRFLPDDDLILPIGSRSPKLSRTAPGIKPGMTVSSPSPYRKRRVPAHAISSIDDEEETEKNRGFCSCSECYEEAAGLDRSRHKISSASPGGTEAASAIKKKKTVSFNAETGSNGKDGGYITAMTVDKKSNDATEKYTPVSLQIITKAKYEADKQRRLERLNRMLNESFKRSEYKPPTTSESAPATTASVTPSVSFGFTALSPEIKLSAENSAAAKIEDMVDGAKSKSDNLALAENSSGTGDSGVLSKIPSTFSFGITSPNALTQSSAADKPQDSQTAASPFMFGVESTAVNSLNNSTTAANPNSAVNTGVDKSGFSFGAPSVISSAPASSGGNTASTFSFGNGSSTSTIVTSSSLSTGAISFGASTTSVNSTPVLGASTAPSIFNISNVNAADTTPQVAPTVAVLPAVAATTSMNVTSSSTSTTAPAGIFSFGAQSTLSVPQSAENKQNTNTDLSKPAAGGFSFGVASPVSTSATTFGTTPQFGISNTTTQAPTVVSNVTAPSTNSIFGQNNSNSQSLGTSLNSTFGATFGTSNAASGNLGTSQGDTSIQPTITSATTVVTGGSAGGSTNVFQFGQAASSSAPPQNATTTASQAPGGFSFAFGQPKTDTTTVSSAFPQLAPALPQPQATSIFGNANSNQTSLFGQGNTSATASSTNTASTFSFGKPPTTTQAASTFGDAGNSVPKPAFGQGGSAFGQPSATSATSTFGQTTGSTAVPTFGQNTGGSTVPAFGGQTAQNATAPAFGQASSTNQAPTFGSSSTGGSAFGQPSSTTNTFGQSGGIFGQAPSGGNSFSASTTGGSNIFGQNNAPNTGFGQTSTTNPASPFGQTTTGSSTFGAQNTASPTPAFGAPAATTTSPFGQSSTGSAFGQPQTNNQSSFSFGGNNTSFGQTAQQPTAFGGSTNQASTFGSSANQQPPPAFGSTANNKPLFGQTAAPANNTNSFSFGQTTSPPASGGFNFGAAANNANQGNTGAPAFGSGGGSFNAPQPGMFGNAPPANNAPASGGFNFGQAAQQTSQGGFNFAAQSPQPGFGQNPPQQQMFSLGASTTTARRRDARAGRRLRN